MLVNNTQDNPDYFKASQTVPRLKKKISKVNSIDIIVMSNDTSQLEKAVTKICDVLSGALITFCGPIPLNIKRKRWTVRTSPHVNKDAMQCFETVLSRRMIRIPKSRESIATLSGIDKISPTVRVEIRGMTGGEK